MLRAPAVFRQSPFVLALALLLTTMGASLQGATAQTPTFDVEQPTASLQRALLVAEEDSQLVDLATALMEARADTEISQSTYKEGVRYFRTFHPQFYGNFFGHPYYATYDSEYVYMSRLRSLAGTEIDPRSGVSGLFSCHPRWYDPAFGGRCEYQFAAFQFLFLPGGSVPLLASAPSIRDSKPIYLGDNCKAKLSPAAYDRRCNLVYEWPDRDNQGRVSRTSGTSTENSSGSSEITAPVEPIQTPDQRIDLPDDLITSMRKTASSLRHAEEILRFRKLVKQKHAAPDLSDRERARMASRLAEVLSMKGTSSPRADGFSRSGLRNETRPAPDASGSQRMPEQTNPSDASGLNPIRVSPPDFKLPEKPAPNFPGMEDIGTPDLRRPMKSPDLGQPANSPDLGQPANSPDPGQPANSPDPTPDRSKSPNSENP
ncbi:MAG: hypothetical protein ABEL04_04615 [Salinibacter sp.]|uniref:hypothetical protein n=1 Tax=Salinibacter sp. TaxID=2065818 RepID=UPI0035D4F970